MTDVWVASVQSGAASLLVWLLCSCTLSLLWLLLGPDRASVARDRLERGETDDGQTSNDAASLSRRYRRPMVVSSALSAAVVVATCLGWAAGLPVVAFGSGVVGLLVVGVVWSLIRRSRHRTMVERRRARVIELLEALSAELTSGLPPVRALRAIAADWPDLSAAAAAAQAGGDVPAVLLELSNRPGLDALRHVACAWAVTEQSGAGLSDVLDRITRSQRAEQEIRREVASALAAPQATARMLALLPLLGLGLGAGLGGNPVGLLLETGFGLICLFCGTALASAGLWWVERLAAAAEP